VHGNQAGCIDMDYQAVCARERRIRIVSQKVERGRERERGRGRERVRYVGIHIYMFMYVVPILRCQPLRICKYVEVCAMQVLKFKNTLLDYV